MPRVTFSSTSATGCRRRTRVEETRTPSAATNVRSWSTTRSTHSKRPTFQQVDLDSEARLRGILKEISTCDLHLCSKMHP